MIEINSFNDAYYVLIVPHWFAETYVKGYTQRKYCLVKAITLLVRNTVEGVKFTCIIIKVYFVPVVVCS